MSSLRCLKMLLRYNLHIYEIFTYICSSGNVSHQYGEDFWHSKILHISSPSPLTQSHLCSNLYGWRWISTVLDHHINGIFSLWFVSGSFSPITCFCVYSSLFVFTAVAITHCLPPYMIYVAIPHLSIPDVIGKGPSFEPTDLENYWLSFLGCLPEPDASLGHSEHQWGKKILQEGPIIREGFSQLVGWVAVIRAEVRGVLGEGIAETKTVKAEMETAYWTVSSERWKWN